MKKEKSRTPNSGYTLFEMLLAIAVLAIGVSFIFPAFFRSGSALNHMLTRYEAGLALNNLLVEAEQHLREGHVLKEWPPSGMISMGAKSYPYEISIVPIQVLRKSPLDKGVTIYRLEGKVYWSEDLNRRVSGAAYAVK